MRESGYYWVRRQGKEWEIAIWSKAFKDWLIAGEIVPMSEKHFEEINENRLTPPN